MIFPSSSSSSTGITCSSGGEGSRSCELGGLVPISGSAAAGMGIGLLLGG